MQVVGKPCEVCTRVIKSEMSGTGCVDCQRFFHDACMLAPPPTTPKDASETYRTQAPKPRKKARKVESGKVRCPSCGADVRQAQRERDRIIAAEREELDGRRRAAESTRASVGGASFRVLRLALMLALAAVAVLIRLFRH